MDRFDVAVVGARCAGSPLATMLVRRGLSVCLVDRAQFPSETPSTHIIQPGVQVLDRLGVLDAIVGAGAVKLDRWMMVIDNAVRIESTLDRAIFAHPVMCVKRVTLVALLVEAAGAAGADVRTGVRVTGVTTEDGRVTGWRRPATRRSRRGWWWAPMAAIRRLLRWSVLASIASHRRARRWPGRISRALLTGKAVCGLVAGES